MRPSSDTNTEIKQSPGRSLLSTLNASAVVIAALYFGRELLVPMVLASLLAFVLAPACKLLQRIRLPRVLAVLVAVVLAFAIIGGIGMIVGRQAAMLGDSLPSYEATVMTKWTALSTGNGVLHRLTGGLSNPLLPPGDANAKPGASPVAALGLDFGSSGLSLARTLAAPLLGPVATAGVVLVFTIFILLYSEDLRDRLVRLVGRRDLHRTILTLNDAARRLSRFFLFQLGLNTAFGTLIGLSLWITGLPNPILWGIVAAIMRFVPYVGTVIAVLPPLLLALAVVPGWTLALSVLALFIVSEMIMGQVIEPLIYGHSTGLSPIAVIVATAFWAFLWGPVGLLLATPLTVCLVVIGRHVDSLAFFDVMLGDGSPLEPAETFYQRALEGNAKALTAISRQRIAASSLAEFYDKVAMRGLALAQGDLSRDVLAFERLEAIHTQIDVLLASLAPRPGTKSASPPSPSSLPPDWRADGAIVCIPGRGQLDDLAASMATQVLRNAGFGVEIAPNVVLGASASLPETFANTRLCCVSVLEEGSSVAGIRYFIRRIQKRMPGARIVVCLWHAAGSSSVLSELRSENHEEYVVLSIGELLALALALSARATSPKIGTADLPA